tara:strand:- start:254 stop:1210 length:957 start_codon:yes stop_codon:yes gene_type:complete
MASNLVDMRLLEVRSGMFFEYPKFGNVDKNIMFFLPFWENPVITEAKEARVVEYNPINRGSTLFAHVGANARNLTIEFNLTVPHIMRSINSVLNSQKLVEHLSTEKEKKRFNSKNPFEGTIPTTRAEDNIRLWKQLVIENNLGRAGELPSQRPPSLLRPGLESFGEPEERLPTPGEPVGTGTVLAPLKGAYDHIPLNESPTALKAINSAVYILETIRSCVAGNAKSSVLGPPILRLRHGAAYNDVPLICRDYSISIIEEAGYDLKTLIPHRMVITLNTSEVRTGDFGTFKPGKWMSRDNVAGWEAVMEHGSADPGYLK